MSHATLPPVSEQHRKHVPQGCPLSARELEVLHGILEGLEYEQVAQRLGIAHSTARTHIANAYRRLGLHSGTQAVLACVKEGWLRWDGEYATVAPLPREIEHEQADTVTVSQRVYLHAVDLWLREIFDRDAADRLRRRCLADVLAEGD